MTAKFGLLLAEKEMKNKGQGRDERRRLYEAWNGMKSLVEGSYSIRLENEICLISPNLNRLDHLSFEKILTPLGENCGLVVAFACPNQISSL